MALRQPPSSSGNGFTLVELVVVLMILGVLTGVAAPRLLSINTDSEAAAILATIDTIFDAAERFAAENGRLPANASRGEFPPELTGYLSESVFVEDSALGYPFDWDGPGTAAPFYGVNLRTKSGPMASEPIYLAVERIGGDGSPTSGWITANGRNVNFRLAEK